MSARAMWKAELKVGEVHLPVKLYAAVQDAKVHFRMLHDTDRTPVKQQMVAPDSQQIAPRDQIRRAVPVDRGVFVVITDEELVTLEPKPSRDITVERVVPAANMDLRWFDRPYYLGPDGDEESYFALANALESTGRLGISHWVMRKKSYAGALRARHGYLMLETLRHAEDLVELQAVRPPKSREPDKRELGLAEQLISALEDTFDAASYRDEHREQVLALLDAKAKNNVVQFPKASRRKPGRSLVEELEASLKSDKRTRKMGGQHGSNRRR